MDQQQIQQIVAQLQDELNTAVAGFKAKGFDYFKKVLAVAAALALVGYFALYRTSTAQLTSVKRQVSVLREVAKYARDYRSLKDQIAVLEDKFPTEAERKDWLFALVLGSAKQSGLSIESISAQKEEERGDMPFVKVSIDVTAKGTYHQIGDWIARLEGAPRFTQIESFVITKFREGGAEAPPMGLNLVQLTLATVIPKGLEGL